VTKIAISALDYEDAFWGLEMVKKGVSIAFLLSAVKNSRS